MEEPNARLMTWNLNPPSAAEAAYEARLAERDRIGGQGEVLATLGVLSGALITLLMVFRGNYLEMARARGPGLETGTTALAIALGLTLCIFVGFLMAEKLTPRMGRWWTYAGAWLCIGLFCVWSVGTSSWFAFMSSAGGPALEMHLVASAERLDRAVSRATEEIRKVRGMPGALRSKAAGFALQAKSEAAGGGATGAKGTGPLSQSLEGGAAVLNAGAAEIERALVKADGDAEAMRAKVRALTASVVDRQIPVHERESGFLEGAAAVRAQVGAMHDAGLVEIVKAAMAAVRSSVASLPTAKTELGARQQEAMDALRADMARVADDLGAVAEGFGGVKAESGALLEMVSLSEIVWRYKAHFIPELVLAVGIDLFAVWALMMLSLYGVGPRPPKSEPTRFNGFLDLDQLIGVREEPGGGIEVDPKKHSAEKRGPGREKDKARGRRKAA